MAYEKQSYNVNFRIYIIWFLLCAALVGLLWRLIDLNILNRSFLLKENKARILRVINIPTYRGIITDRLGSLLAVSIPVTSVWIDPQIFAPSLQQLTSLASLLNLPAAIIQKNFMHSLAEDHQFLYLKRHVPLSIISKIKMLQIPGLFFQTEFQRDYPQGEVTAHVVGMTNIDDQGQEGLELAYNSWLSGLPGQQQIVKDRVGHIVRELALLKKPVQGHVLTLSLDNRLQYFAYQALAETIDQYHAESGSVVILDVKTGEILAMVNQPSYDPNNHALQDRDRYRNRAVTDNFEPGSVMKPFTVAFALESGRYQPNTVINTNPGWMSIGGYAIRDDLNYGTITLTELIKKSSNIAAAKILLSLQPQQYDQFLKKFGFGERTTLDFPGESSGALIAHDVWRPSIIATLAYGYGIAVTALQLAHAYAILANGGVNIPVTFLKQDSSPVGTRILNAKIANEINQMLETVVQPGGTGTRAAVAHYRAAGKTGTAYLAGPHGYQKQHYVSSFVGFAPASQPRIVVAVVIRDPHGNHLGGLVAAPLFSKITADAMRLLNIPPDNFAS